MDKFGSDQENVQTDTESVERLSKLA